jgi:hypothetical protein
MKNILAGIGLVAIGTLISAIIILPFSVYVIMDIAKLFNVERILIIPKEAMFGLMIILSIITTKMKKTKKKEGEKEISETGVDMFVSYIETLLVLLISWGIAYVVHAINF